MQEDQIKFDLGEEGMKDVTICKISAYEAAAGADAVVIVTEWDDFKDDKLDYQKIYEGMHKPAFLFDGRLLIDAKKLRESWL